MNKKLFISLFLVVSSFSFSENYNQFHAQVELVQPLVVKVESNMEFGNILVGSNYNYPTKKGRVMIYGVPYNLVDLKVKIKNTNNHIYSGTFIPLINKDNDKIYTMLFYNLRKGMPQSNTLFYFNREGIIEFDIDGYINLSRDTQPGKYSQTLEFVVRYD